MLPSRTTSLCCGESGRPGGVRHPPTTPRPTSRATLWALATSLKVVVITGRALGLCLSSSVYGGNTCLPFSEHQSVDHPVSLYAASKKANNMAHTYSHPAAAGNGPALFHGLWALGRPDMALFLFTRAMLAGELIGLQQRPNA